MNLVAALMLGATTFLMIAMVGISIVGLSCQCDFVLDHDSWSPRYNVLAINTVEIFSLVIAAGVGLLTGNWTIQAFERGNDSD